MDSQKSNFFDGFYKRLPNYESFPVFKRNESIEYVLFLHFDGDLRIGSRTSAEGNARSLDIGLPTPGLTKGWEILYNNGWKTDYNFTLSELNEANSESTSTGIIIGVTAAALVFVVLLIGLALVLIQRSRKLAEEEPKIEENMYYGEDYNDTDTECAITDNNDYYE